MSRVRRTNPSVVIFKWVDREGAAKAVVDYYLAGIADGTLTEGSLAFCIEPVVNLEKYNFGKRKNLTDRQYTNFYNMVFREYKSRTAGVS